MKKRCIPLVARYQILYGDFFDFMALGEFDAIAHGCNCQGHMGSGFAGQVIDRIPEVKTANKAAWQRGEVALGRISRIDTRYKDRPLTVFNCYTQEYYGRLPGRRYVSYAAVEECLRTVSVAPGVESVCFPLIGGGLAQGVPKILLGIMEKVFTDPASTVRAALILPRRL